MKRRHFLRRILLLDLLMLLPVVAVIVLTAMVAFAPRVIGLSREEIIADSLRARDILTYYPPDTTYATRLDTLPPGGVRLDVDRSLNQHREFNDSNYLHIAAASFIGINPIDSDRDIWNINRPVEHVISCPEFYIDELRHSLPYLVPQAHSLLRDIGSAFNDSLSIRGGGAYRIKVTSLLRTNSTIHRLRRRNGNSVAGSAHLYATTFDISYSNFACDNDSLPRSVDDLRGLLAMVLRDLRNQGRCYVKHERHQSCFHITTRQ